MPMSPAEKKAAVDKLSREMDLSKNLVTRVLDGLDEMGYSISKVREPILKTSEIPTTEPVATETTQK